MNEPIAHTAHVGFEIVTDDAGVPVNVVLTYMLGNVGVRLMLDRPACEQFRDAFAQAAEALPALAVASSMPDGISFPG